MAIEPTTDKTQLKERKTAATAKQKEPATIVRSNDTTTPMIENATYKLLRMKLTNEVSLAANNPKAAAKALRTTKNPTLHTLADELEGKSRKRQGLQGQ